MKIYVSAMTHVDRLKSLLDLCVARGRLGALYCPVQLCESCLDTALSDAPSVRRSKRARNRELIPTPTKGSGLFLAGRDFQGAWQ